MNVIFFIELERLDPYTNNSQQGTWSDELKNLIKYSLYI